QGCYRDQAAFLGMLDAIMKVEDRNFRGKGLQNIKYDASFDMVCANLALISPRAYRTVQAEFAGRSIRSIQSIQQKKGRFKPGIVDSNFDDLQQWAKDLGFPEGPFIIAVDDTKLLPGLRAYCDGDNWVIGGLHGEVKAFDSYAKLANLADIDKEDLAEKVLFAPYSMLDNG
ncbi:hypothetical protein OF83DRAFT_1071981, partial [Amylostereum chailletii]